MVFKIPKGVPSFCTQESQILLHFLLYFRYAGGVNVLERFESKVVLDGPTMSHMGTNCYGWTGTISQGRARFSLNGTTTHASRTAWILYIGDIPDGLWVLHHCDNALCVRVEHLYLGTHQQNMDDMNNRCRNRHTNKTHCLRGHPFDEVNTYIRPDGHRQCRVCSNDSHRVRRAKAVATRMRSGVFV